MSHSERLDRSIENQARRAIAAIGGTFEPLTRLTREASRHRIAALRALGLTYSEIAKMANHSETVIRAWAQVRDAKNNMKMPCQAWRFLARQIGGKFFNGAELTEVTAKVDAMTV